MHTVSFLDFALGTTPGNVGMRTLLPPTASWDAGFLSADALQDSYQRAYVRWKKISRYDAPAAWVRHVAINRSRDMIRSNDRRLRNEERAAGSHIVVDEQSDDSLFGLLLPLPERQRTAMALHYLEDLSVEQVADEMGISSGAVKYHLNQGRGKIRPILEKRES
ncbi:MAG: sigma-70 family RNA polymerase sigma factor [Acidimicrobiales bacterium]